MLWLSTQISPVLREIVFRKRWVLRSQCGPGFTPRRSTPASNSVLNKLHALDDAGTSYRRPLAHVSLSNGGVVVDRLACLVRPHSCRRETLRGPSFPNALAAEGTPMQARALTSAPLQC